MCQTTEDCAGFGASDKTIEQMHQYTSNVSWKFKTGTVITFLFIQTDHWMGILWHVLQSFHQTPNVS